MAKDEGTGGSEGRVDCVEEEDCRCTLHHILVSKEIDESEDEGGETYECRENIRDVPFFQFTTNVHEYGFYYQQTDKLAYEGPEEDRRMVVVSGRKVFIGSAISEEVGYPVWKSM